MGAPTTEKTKIERTSMTDTSGKVAGILGAGFSGLAIGESLHQAGFDVWGTTRSEDKFEKLTKHNVDPVCFDGETLDGKLKTRLKETTHLVVSIAPPRAENVAQPDAMVDPTLAALENKSLADVAPNLQWIDYLSTVGVYGNHNGAWIDEETPVAPLSARSRQRVRAEVEWLGIAEATDIPVGIFRLSGIYGPGRNALLSAEKGKARRLVKRDQVFNRIHVGDIAQFLTLAACKKTAGIFNITDNEPSPPQDVVAFAHDLMAKEAPPEIDFETADLTPMARSFYGENKRVSNAKSRSIFGTDYQWPNYREALTRMWNEDSWRG